jgi:methionyl-tRNA formyltransferase
LGKQQRSLRLGFAGTPRFAVPALDALAGSTHRVVTVFTKADGTAGRGRKPHMSEVKLRALELGLPVYQPASFRTEEAHRTLHDLQLDALVVVAYGLILPPAALAATRLGCFNIHASLLPRWRGAAPVQRAILAGDALAGVAIMRMEERLDSGPLLATRSVDIGAADTAGSLADRLAGIGAQLMCQTVDALALGTAVEAPQPEVGVTYAEKISKAEAMLEWREDAVLLARRIRAFNPAPVAETRWEGTQLRIWDAEVHEQPGDEQPGEQRVDAHPAQGSGRDLPGTVLAASADGIIVACGTGTLRVTRLQLAGRKPMAAGEFIKAQRLGGARFTSP